MSYFKAKKHQIRFRLGLCPRPCWGSLQRSPDPLANGEEGWLPPSPKTLPLLSALRARRSGSSLFTIQTLIMMLVNMIKSWRYWLNGVSAAWCLCLQWLWTVDETTSHLSRMSCSTLPAFECQSVSTCFHQNNWRTKNLQCPRQVSWLTLHHNNCLHYIVMWTELMILLIFCLMFINVW